MLIANDSANLFFLYDWQTCFFQNVYQILFTYNEHKKKTMLWEK